MTVCEADRTTSLPSRIRGIGGGYSPSRSPEFISDTGKMILPDRNAPLIPPWMNLFLPLVFPGMWLFIGLVSAIDTYLTVKFREYLWDLEVNPLARMLLRLDGWEPALLIASKFFGSIVVLGVLLALRHQNRRVGLCVTAALASFQLWLLGYLILA